MGIIKRHRKSNPVLLDPFCGRGTTLYAARRSNLSSFGLDTSAIATAIAQAKLAKASLEQVLKLAEELLHATPSNLPSEEFFQYAFAPSTLEEVCSLREGLKNESSDRAAILRAAALGCLHGPMPMEGGTASYFSNQMPRTFASKPAYSVRFWKQRDMKPPKVSVLDVIRKKLSRIADLDAVSPGKPQDVQCKDARLASSYGHVSGASVTITSPPYYGMRTYVEDQWLRAWFLGGPSEVDYGNGGQLRHSGHDVFITELAKVWANVLAVSNDDAHLYVRFGAIPSIKSDPRKILTASLEEAAGWKLLSIRNANTSDAGRRQADQMGSASAPADEFDFHAVRA